MRRQLAASVVLLRCGTAGRGLRILRRLLRARRQLSLHDRRRPDRAGDGSARLVAMHHASSRRSGGHESCSIDARRRRPLRGRRAADWTWPRSTTPRPTGNPAGRAAAAHASPPHRQTSVRRRSGGRRPRPSNPHSRRRAPNRPARQTQTGMMRQRSQARTLEGTAAPSATPRRSPGSACRRCSRSAEPRAPESVQTQPSTVQRQNVHRKRRQGSVQKFTRRKRAATAERDRSHLASAASAIPAPAAGPAKCPTRLISCDSSRRSRWRPRCRASPRG